MKRNLIGVTLILLITASGPPTSAQTSGGSNPGSSTQQSTSAPTGRTNADENFELDITERRITERDFAASTTVEAGEETARGLRLRVGVEVGAEEISLLLRNVRGRVRFRASLERVLERLNARHPPRVVP